MYSLGVVSRQVRGKTVETDEVTGEKIQEKVTELQRTLTAGEEAVT